MFDLEKALLEWRAQMSAAGIRNAAVLQELESHLRDYLDDLLNEGQAADEAFRLAVQRLGPANALHREFIKSRPSTHLETMKHKFLALLTVIALIAVELAFLLPALAHAKASGMLNPLTLVVVLANFAAFNALVACGVRAWYKRSHAG